MTTTSRTLLAKEWQTMMTCYTENVRELVKKVALQHKKELAIYFYEQMMQEPTAKLYLSNEVVHNRLRGSLQAWLAQLFSVSVQADFLALIDTQEKVGMVHARIDLPVHLVLMGARNLKRKFIQLLAQEEEGNVALQQKAFYLISDTLDFAMEVMSSAYARDHERKSRNEESYRLFSAIQNAAAEKGRQNTALLDWENKLMFDLATGVNVHHLLDIKKSEFGLWFYHKGSYAFEGLEENRLVSQSLDKISELTKKLDQLDHRVLYLKNIHTEVKKIKINIDYIFDKYSELDAGRDELTKLLNRKYLSVVLSKEISYARRKKTNFALLAIDLDFFKKVNDKHGHIAGDQVLQQLAALLVARSRAGDYVFRMGGEEFLLLLVDMNAESATKAAHKMSQHIREEAFNLPNGEVLHLTASIGITLYDGHPDYSLSLNRADTALYKAKNSGRDQVVYL